MPIEICNINNYPELVTVVAKWYMSFWGERCPERTQKQWEAFIGRNSDKPPLTLIAIDTNKNPAMPVGTASLKLAGMGEYKPEKLWLSAVYVPPEYRGNNIATALIKEIIDIAAKQDTDLYLFTRTNGRIYEKLGWRTVHMNAYQGSNVRVMRKSLVYSMNHQSFHKTPLNHKKTNQAQHYPSAKL